jgi:hypothetical protein
MPLKLTKEELLWLMRFASEARPLQLLYRGQDDVVLLGEQNSWAQQWIRYIRMRQAGVEFRTPPATPQPSAWILFVDGVPWLSSW